MEQEREDVISKVFDALGQASMCWSETPKGIFDSTKAVEIGQELISSIQKEYIPLSEAFEFAKFLGIKGWEYNKTYKCFIDSCNFDSGQTRTFESLWTQFKEHKTKE